MRTRTIIAVIAISLATAFHSEAKKPKTLRIATFNNQYENKWHPWSERAPRVWKLIADEKWDIVGMQEPFWNQVEDMDSTLTDYAWIGTSTDGKIENGYYHYNPIFYRKDRLELIDWGRFWFSETPDVPKSKSWDAHTPRFTVWGHFRDKNTGKDFYQFNSHYDHIGETARQNSSRLLLQKIKEIAGDKPFFCTGDYNTYEDTPAYNILVEGGLIDTRFAAKEKVNTGIASWNDWKPANIVDKPSDFDHVFISPGTKALLWKLDINEYDGKTPSDHYPITVIWKY